MIGNRATDFVEMGKESGDRGKGGVGEERIKMQYVYVPVPHD